MHVLVYRSCPNSKSVCRLYLDVLMAHTHARAYARARTHARTHAHILTHTHTHTRTHTRTHAHLQLIDVIIGIFAYSSQNARAKAKCSIFPASQNRITFGRSQLHDMANPTLLFLSVPISRQSHLLPPPKSECS